MYKTLSQKTKQNRAAKQSKTKVGKIISNTEKDLSMVAHTWEADPEGDEFEVNLDYITRTHL